VTLRKLNATRTGSASSAAYHIVYRDGQYKVFDKAQRFRLGFATLPAAQAYIDMRSAHRNSQLATSQSQ
jgi:hypothetical protein